MTSYGSAIYLMPLEIEEGMDEEMDPVEYLKRRTNSTKAPISAILYDTLSGWVIMGDQQGNVVAYNLKFECTMSYVGAHEDRITWLGVHPSICGFLSYSNGSQAGSKLQVWSCNFRDMIEAFVEFGDINSVIAVSAGAMLVVLCNKLHFLLMHQLYIFFAPLTSGARSLYSTASPMYLTKLISASDDNCVRLFSTHGTQLNVQILPPDTVYVTQAAFSGNNNCMFTVILKSGEILISDNSTCPAKYKRVLLNDGPRVTSMTTYEYFFEIRDEFLQPKNPRLFYPISVRIMVGTEEGNIVTVNEVTGKPEAVTPVRAKFSSVTLGL